MNILETALRNNRTTMVIFVLLAWAGITTFRQMPRLEDPEFVIRDAVVVTPFPGASPDRVENLVTDTLETYIRELDEVERVTSQSRNNVSIITVSIKEDIANLQPVWQRLRNKVRDAEAELAEGVHPPQVHDDFGDVFGIMLALTGADFTPAELKTHAETIRDRLHQLPAVARVELFGLQPERIYIEISNARLAGLGLSPYTLAQMLRAQNAIQPGGDAKVAGERIIIEPTGEFRSVEEIRNTSLRLPGGEEAVLLRDIAEVRRGYVEPADAMARFNGEDAVWIAVSMVSGENIIHLGTAIRAAMTEIQADLPLGLDLEELYMQPDFVAQSIDEFMVNLATAVFFVFVVMLLFTGLRTGIIAGAILPMAVLLSIALMPLFGVELQKVSIAALIIALGLLVSNGIVMSENILVRLSEGEERLAAAQGAVRELAFPLLASQLTTILAFLPIATAQSIVGEYTRSLFIVVAIALLGSWVLALTFTPLLSYAFQRPPKPGKTTGGESRSMRGYRRMLVAALHHRQAVVIGVALATVLAIWGFTRVPTIFFPPLEREMFLVKLDLPAGHDIEITRQRTLAAEEWLLDHEAVTAVGGMIGSGGPRWYLSLAPEQTNPAYAMLIVHTRKLDDVQTLIPQLRKYLETTQPEVRARVEPLEMGPPVGFPIQIRLQGDDIPTLYRQADEIRAVLHTTAGVFNVHDDWGEWTRKMVVAVRQEQAKRAGLTSQDIALSLLTQMSGIPVTEYRAEGDLLPIILRAPADRREDLAGLEDMHVHSFTTGRNLPLLQVARTELEWQPSNIRRRNQTRTITLLADVTGRYSSDALAEIEPELATLQAAPDWPLGYALEVGGEDEESDRAQASIMAGVPLAAALLFLVLLVQFNSIRATLLIVLSIGPMMVGITPGMWLTRTPFGFMAMLGLISLAGIIVNNAILLLDRINTERRNGLTAAEAIVAAATKRLRPILLMAFTAIIGLLPLAVRGGALWRPMANVMIFGLLTATVVGLIFTPVLYALFFRAGQATE